MGKRGSGEGSIFKRKDGRWVAKVSVGRDSKGKLVTRSAYAKTQREAREKLEELKRQASIGATTSTKTTVGEWLATWLELAENELRASSHSDYEATVRNHIAPDPISSVPLHRVAIRDVEAFLKRAKASGKSARIQQKSFITLQRSLSVAKKRRHISENPCSFISTPTYKAPEAASLTEDELAALLEVMEGERLAPLAKLALATGMRLGELLGLRWSDVDLDNARLSVRRAQSEHSGHVTYGQPKTKAGNRTISLDNFALKTLTEHRDAMEAEGNHKVSGEVFVAVGGGPLRRSNMRRDFWNPVREQAGVSVPFHALRHTSATMMLRAGIHPKIAQQRLGHADIAMTLNTYSHVIDGLDAQAAGAIGDAMQKASERSALNQDAE